MQLVKIVRSKIVNKRPMDLGLLDNTDRSSKHTVMYDKQKCTGQITLQTTLTSTRSKLPHLCFTSVTEVNSVLVQGQLFSCQWQF